MGQLPYRRLIVWQKAYALAVRVLELAQSEGLAKRFYFRDQLCAAAMSVPANIAEGNGRSTPLDYASFLDRARGSLYEMDTWLLAAADREYLSQTVVASLEPSISEVGAMLMSMANKIRRGPSLRSRS